MSVFDSFSIQSTSFLLAFVELKSLCLFVYGVLVLFHGTSKSSDSRCCLRRGSLPDLVDKKPK